VITIEPTAATAASTVAIEHQVAGVRACPVGAPSAVVVVLRVFLAIGWMRAAVEKLIHAEWWHGNGVRSFLAGDRAMAVPFVRPAMDGVLHDRAALVAVLVVLAELGCSVAIATGCVLRTGLWTATVLNVAFVLCGRVNPSAFYLVMQAALLFTIAEGSIGRRTRRRPAFGHDARTARAARDHAGTALLVVLGVAMVPFIRTLAPADVIADPAAMLAFLGILAGAVNVTRWASHQPAGTRAHGAATRLADWSRAQRGRPGEVEPASSTTGTAWQATRRRSPAPPDGAPRGSAARP
jgi:thiosulfate dehydrogenase [quinone] large subunit